MRKGCHYFISLSVCLSVCLCVCVTFAVFTDCESCTRPISTNPGSTKASEYGRTRGTCFVASSLEVVAVAWQLWSSWCVLGGAGFFRVFLVVDFFFSSNAHGLPRMRSPCLIYLSTSNEAWPRERSDRDRFLPLGQKSLVIPGCVQGAII